MFRHKITLGGVCKGMIAGAIGGAVGSWTMNQLQSPSPKAVPKKARGRSTKGGGNVRERKTAEAGGDDPTVKVAQMTSRKLFDHELTEQEKQIAGPAVHYSYGMAVGALYGGLAELWPNAKVGLGMGYGMAVWALGSEAALPALRLSPPPTEVPVQKHADTFAAHVCYGLTLDFIRRISKVLL